MKGNFLTNTPDSLINRKASAIRRFTGRFLENFKNYVFVLDNCYQKEVVDSFEYQKWLVIIGYIINYPEKIKPKSIE
ncbi:hypothetical protein AHMF7605_16850 [Adhaeribacter arboris]|uniref:Uncharacterized protein n=1 Tax=Adhaeribacter arboris TaxID=2072846 RepID=A0A2T2YHT3_9BACT|nr:hypothetical protein [Adhaeribacter arboris]PSR55052.1 hypothetical protein AHMF7605_16850 [Adhaeribacter arboris]